MSGHKTNKYLVLITVALGTVLSAYVSSSINIALPNIMTAFGFTMDSVVWVSLAYMIPYGATLPIMGKLGDLFGRKKMYLTGLAVFTVATLATGLAVSSGMLLFFRFLQGLGAGLLFPNAMALVSVAFPASERGQALGMWGAVAAGGGALGPTIGGYIVEYLNWRLIFYSIIPISLLGLFLALTFLEESKAESGSPAIDYPGALLLVLSLSTLLMGLNQGSDKGWTSAYILAMFAVTILAMAAFILVELKSGHPVVDLGLFKNSTFAMSNLVGFLSFMALYGGMFLLPFFLRNILGYSAVRAGVALLPLVGSMVLLAPVGGKLADRAGSRLPAAIGMAIIALALYSFHTLDDMTAYPAIALRLIVMGAGLAFTMSPLSNGVMGSLPPEKTGMGSGVFNLFKNVGGSVGVAIMGTLLDSRQTFHAAVLQDHLTLAAEATRQTLALLQAGFQQSGMAAGQAQAAAVTVLGGMVSKQAAIMAFEDVFLVTALLAAGGILAALLIRDPAKNKADSPDAVSRSAEVGA